MIEELKKDVEGQMVLDEYRNSEKLGRSARLKLVQIAVNALVRRAGTQYVVSNI